MRFKSYAKNENGSDYVVGDIHGCFSKLKEAMQEAGFNYETDRLFSVGDLVDRGHECEMVTDWLKCPWFFPVRGNHDDFAIWHVRNGKIDAENYIRNGGAWFLGLGTGEQEEIATALEQLPIAIEIETDSGMVGIVHAECPYGNWPEFKAEMLTEQSRTKSKAMDDWCMWARERIESNFSDPIEGIHALIVGHSPVSEPVILGNVFYIDTMGWRPEGKFTLAKIQ